MGLENLFQGLQMFQQGLQQYSTSKAIGQATEAVNQMNQSEMTDQQKRVAQMQLGNQLALQLGQIGAPVSQIQSATGAIKPEQFASPEEMIMKSMLEGNQAGVKQGQELVKMINAPKIAAEHEKMKLQSGYDLQKVDRAGMWDLKKSMIAASTKEPKAPDPKEAEFLSNVKAGIRYTQSLDEAIDKAGTWEGFRGLQDSDAAAKLNSVPYQLALTSAKIKDPGSVVSGKEVEVAEQRLASLGFFQSKERAKAAMQYLRADFKQAYKDRKSSFEELGGKYPTIKALDLTEGEALSIGRPQEQGIQTFTYEGKAGVEERIKLPNGGSIPKSTYLQYMRNK